mgnify:FL=1
MLLRNSTLPQVLARVYPEYSWDCDKFIENGRIPFKHWQNNANLLRALDRAEKKLGIEKVFSSFSLVIPWMLMGQVKPEDWYTVQLSDLREMGFPSSIQRWRLADLLKEKYPDHQWDKPFLLKGKVAQQRTLERSVASLFKV